jgi:hypothetical protein
VTFAEVLPAENITYSITKARFNNSSSTISITNAAIYRKIVMTLISYPVTFTVRNENSVNVIGATIELTGYGTQITNSTGVATFAKVIPANKITYSIAKTGFNIAIDTISVIDTAVIENVVMRFKSYPVIFNLTDENLFPIDGAIIELTGYETQITDSTGTATFSEVRPINNIAYSISKTGFADTTGTLSISNAAIYENIVMTLITYPVTFTVSDENSNSIDGATLELTGYGTQTTNSDGIATFTNVIPAENITYFISKTGFNDAEGTISVIDTAVFENVVISLISSISDNTRGDVPNLLIYPNPASKEFSISSTQNVESLVILNLHGQVVYKFKGKLMKNEKYQIDVSELLSGIYLIKADSKIVRLIVE